MKQQLARWLVLGAVLVFGACGGGLAAPNIPGQTLPDPSATLPATGSSEGGTATLPTPDRRNLVDITAANAQLTTLSVALQAVGLSGTFRGDGPYTIFAPTDTAFANLPDGALEMLVNDTDLLRQILLYHVVEGEVTSARLAEANTLVTLQGEPIVVTTVAADGATGQGLRINNQGQMVVGDIRALNGVIHIIDTVLLPPGVRLDGAPATPE